jgi:hypothetical protein
MDGLPDMRTTEGRQFVRTEAVRCKDPNEPLPRWLLKKKSGIDLKRPVFRVFFEECPQRLPLNNEPVHADAQRPVQQQPVLAINRLQLHQQTQEDSSLLNAISLYISSQNEQNAELRREVGRLSDEVRKQNETIKSLTLQFELLRSKFDGITVTENVIYGEPPTRPSKSPAVDPASDQLLPAATDAIPKQPVRKNSRNKNKTATLHAADDPCSNSS